MRFAAAGCLVVLSTLLVQPAVAEDFIKGIYSSTEGCAALVANTVDEGDFLFLSAKGFEAIEFNCEFVQVYPRKELPGWTAVAFCEEPEHPFPGLFSIFPLDESTLKVSQPESAEGGGATARLSGEFQLCPGT